MTPSSFVPTPVYPDAALAPGLTKQHTKPKICSIGKSTFNANQSLNPNAFGKGSGCREEGQEKSSSLGITICNEF